MSLTIPSGTSASSAALSGLRAAQRNLDTTAHKVANLQTPGFNRQTVVQTERSQLGGVDATVRPGDASLSGNPGGDGFAHLPDDLVGQTMSLYSFAANLKTVEAEDQMLGSLLDTRA